MYVLWRAEASNLRYWVAWCEAPHAANKRRRFSVKVVSQARLKMLPHAHLTAKLRMRSRAKQDVDVSNIDVIYIDIDIDVSLSISIFIYL